MLSRYIYLHPISIPFIPHIYAFKTYIYPFIPFIYPLTPYIYPFHTFYIYPFISYIYPFFTHTLSIVFFYTLYRSLLSPHQSFLTTPYICAFDYTFSLSSHTQSILHFYFTSYISAFFHSNLSKSFSNLSTLLHPTPYIFFYQNSSLHTHLVSAESSFLRTDDDDFSESEDTRGVRILTDYASDEISTQQSMYLIPQVVMLLRSCKELTLQLTKAVVDATTAERAAIVTGSLNSILEAARPVASRCVMVKGLRTAFFFFSFPHSPPSALHPGRFQG